MANRSDEWSRRLRGLHWTPATIIAVSAVVVLLVVALVLFFTSWVTIDPEEKGVVRRFGKYDRTLDPGLHFKLPFDWDHVDKIPVKRQLKEEFGFQTSQPGVRSQYSQDNYEQESQMLTGDLNVASVEWVTQYRVSNPRDYLFKVRNLNMTFRDMNEAVMREIVGDHTINEVLTTGRTEIENAAKTELQDRCNQYEMGLVIDQVILQDVNPPDPVKPAFNEVNQAQQEKEKKINEARSAYNKVVPRARGEAEQDIEEARGYAVERVNRARGEAERFQSLFKAYQEAPAIMRQRLYLETMQKVMGQVGRKIIMDPDASGVLPFVNLDSTKNP